MSLINKKKGNSLIILLVIISLITIVGGSITTSLAYTGKQNARVKIEEDLLYAAESGLEYVRAKVKDGTINVSSIAAGTTITPAFPNTIFNSYGIGVALSIKNDTSQYTVTSTATKNGKSRIVKGVISPSNNSDIFKYVLCAEKITIECGGALHNVVSRWAVKDKPGSSITANNATEQKRNELEVAPTLNLPNFNFTQANSPIEIKVRDTNSDGVVTKEETWGAIDKFISDGGKGIKGLGDFTSTKLSDIKTRVYLVNNYSSTTSFDLKFIGEQVNLSNTIIIANGNVVIDNTGSKPTLKLDRGTLFGRTFNFKISTFDSAYRLIENKDINGNPNIGFDVFNITDVQNLNNLISPSVTGGFGGVIPGGGSIVGDITDIQYP